MRAITELDRQILGADQYTVHKRILVTDADGFARDLSDLEGIDWCVSVEWGEDIDQPIVQPRIEIRRDVAGTGLSLSPFDESSPLNRRANGSYAPLIDAGRRIRILTATVLPGAQPGPADWREVFDGEIDEVEWQTDPMLVVCRDPGGKLQDTIIEDPREYGSESGVLLHVVMQQLLDDVLGPGVVTLHVPEAPGFMVTRYKPDEGPLLEALQACAGVIGWDVRYAWNETSQAFELTLIRPDREKTTPDHVFGPDDYIDVNRLAVSRADVRNVVEVRYQDSTTHQQERVTVQDDASIARYGRRYMRIVEGEDSPIDTAPEALAMAEAALSDLSEPKAEQEIELRYFWPAQLGDLYRFEANGVHYTTDQTLAVVGIRHRLTEGQQRTILTCRGRPSGGYLTWLKRGRRPPELPPTAVQVPPRALIRILEYTDLSDAVVQITGVVGGMGAAPPTQYRWREYREGSTPGNYSDWLPLDSNRQATVTVARRPKGFVIVEAQVRTASGLESDPVTVRVAPTDGWQDDETGGPKWSHLVDDDGGQSALINEAASKGQNLLGPDAGPERVASGSLLHYLGANPGTPLATLALTAGQVVSGRIWLKSNTGADRLALGVVFFDAGGTIISTHEGTAVRASNYVEAVVENVSVPANAASMTFRARNLDTTETWYARHAMLNRGPKALPFEEPPFRPGRETADVIQPGNTKALIHAAYVDELGRPWLLYDPDTGRDIDVGDIVNPPSISGITLAVEDDGFTDHYTLGWTASANMSATWSVRAQFFREGVLRGTRTAPATNEEILFPDLGAGDGQPNMHSATVELLNDTQQVVMTINSPVVLSTTT